MKPRLRGRAFEVRYADDAVLVFEHEDDARRVLGVLAKRLEKYGLRLHRDKTRMVEFCSPSKSQRGGSQRERSFVMLGFIHYWGRSRKGRWVVKRKTAKGPTQPSVERDWPMVPEEPAQESARAARGTESQVARPLCLLRHHRERCVIGAVPARGPPTMAQMAQPTGRANTDDVGAVCPCAERLSPPCGASRAQLLVAVKMRG